MRQSVDRKFEVALSYVFETSQVVVIMDANLQALSSEAESLFSTAAELAADAGGITRGSYSEKETETLVLLEAFAAKYELAVHHDEADNVYFALSEEDLNAPSIILVGSHVDSVPQGGNFDGLAGVIAGLLLLADMRANHWQATTPVVCLALRGEESAWFGQTYMGSKAALGLLNDSILESTHRDTGRSLADHMADVGANMAKLTSNTPLLDKSRIKLFLEMHIEQGPVLVNLEIPTAAVTGIRGNIRHRTISCRGEGGHSGAVPRYLRKDAVFAFSDLVSRLDEHWQTIEQHGGDLVVTVGIAHTDTKHDAMSRVPGEFDFSFEARSQSNATLDALHALMRSECETIERKRKVKFTFGDPIRSAPAELCPDVMEGLIQASVAEGFSDESIASGAGHDAAIFANAGIPTGMIFIRNRNGSHNPDEAMELSDFMAGYQVIRRYLQDLS